MDGHAAPERDHAAPEQENAASERDHAAPEQDHAAPEQENAASERDRDAAASFERLLPPGPPADALEIVESLGLWERPALAGGRPHLILNMVSSADGRATLAGRSGPLSTKPDRELFHALRCAVDAVLVGAGTLRTERYGRLIAEPARRASRRERGLSEEPLACVVSGRLELTEDLPLLTHAQGRVAILTPSAASLPWAGPQVEYVRAARDGTLDLGAALASVRERYGVELILCEGGPHLACQLLADGLVDELFLTVSPLLAGGEGPRSGSGWSGGEALRILAGGELEPPARLTLRAALCSDSALFLRYGVLGV